MTLSPSPVELRARALTDLRMGLPVVIDMPEPGASGFVQVAGRYA